MVDQLLPSEMHNFVPCPYCQGTGGIREIDPAAMRHARLKAVVTLQQLASRLGCSVPYLSMLERGIDNKRFSYNFAV